MDSAPEFLNLFVDPTGELIYFLAVIAISLAALFMALGQRMRGTTEVAAGRYTVLMAGVVGAWIALMIGALVALITDTSADAVMPPLERAVNMLVIVYTCAAMLMADSHNTEQQSWLTIIVASLGIVAAYILSAIVWGPIADDHSFNEHALGFFWTLIPSFVLIGTIALILTRYRQTADIPLKLIFVFVLLCGYSYTTARISRNDLDGNASGALRLAFLTAMPLLAVIVYRLVLDRLNTAIDEVSEYAEAVSKPQITVTPPPHHRQKRQYAPCAHPDRYSRLTLPRLNR